jgi:threonyl-tRNA synthetase
MRVLLWHCRSLAYVDRRRANRPADVHREVPDPRTARFEDVMLAFTTIEDRDGLSAVREAAQAISTLTQQCFAREGCVLMPFAHLSSRLAAPDRARQLLADLCAAVNEQDCRVSLASFGFHKDLDLHFAALGHPGSVAFREF